MRKMLGFITLLIMIGGAAGAALINVTRANYVVTKIYDGRNAFGVDLVENGPKEVRTEIRLNRDARCYWVRGNGRKDTPMTVTNFMNNIRKGTRVSVTGGRDWDGKINASEVWAQ